MYRNDVKYLDMKKSFHRKINFSEKKVGQNGSKVGQELGQIWVKKWVKRFGMGNKKSLSC
ncbi:hypothetical protein HMPREF3218_0201199 [Prevotella bivia]|uniref:Uncharacterized protein n=1 Tax=Prevotella bivia TaxID=28125 RepID=A0A137SVK9_9BACT|nr:hypothetical protein HMPREF3202_01379 [Prevotella bivia]KXU58103.1 hypothetical protein HMPREF3218_0201199 [Prevotella bivia]